MKRFTNTLGGFIFAAASAGSAVAEEEGPIVKIAKAQFEAAGCTGEEHTARQKLLGAKGISLISDLNAGKAGNMNIQTILPKKTPMEQCDWLNAMQQQVLCLSLSEKWAPMGISLTGTGEVEVSPDAQNIGKTVPESTLGQLTEFSAMQHVGRPVQVSPDNKAMLAINAAKNDFIMSTLDSGPSKLAVEELPEFMQRCM